MWLEGFHVEVFSTPFTIPLGQDRVKQAHTKEMQLE